MYNTNPLCFIVQAPGQTQCRLCSSNWLIIYMIHLHPNPTYYQRFCITAGGNLVMSLGQKSWSQGTRINFFSFTKKTTKNHRETGHGQHQGWVQWHQVYETTFNLYFKNMTNVNDSHHEWHLHFKCSLGAINDTEWWL